MSRVFTIGFTRKSAEEFFTQLREAGGRRVLDVRLNNSSQLAGFAKRDDLRCFLRAVADIDYEHVIELAPTRDIPDALKKHGGEWSGSGQEFLELMARRRIESVVTPEMPSESCLLCSEHLPKMCHRRRIPEHLGREWGANCR